YTLYDTEGSKLETRSDVISVEPSSGYDNKRMVKILYSDLDSNTTYYVGIRPVEKYWGGRHEDDKLYINTGVSFTTSKEGDYSGLGEFKCEVVEYNAIYTYVKLTAPEGFRFYKYKSGLIASLCEDMSDWIGPSGSYKPSSPDFDQEYSEYFIVGFEGLNAAKYYLQYRGDIYIAEDSKFYCICKAAEVVLPAINLSSEDQDGLSVKLMSQTAQFSVFQLSLPEGMIRAYDSSHNIRYTVQRDGKEIFSGNINSNYRWESNTSCIVSVPQSLLRGDCINFTISGSYQYQDSFSGSTSIVHDKEISGGLDIENQATADIISLIYQPETDYVSFTPIINISYSSLFTLYTSSGWTELYLYENKKDFSEDNYILRGESDSDGKIRLNKTDGSLQKGHQYIVKMTGLYVNLIDPDMNAATFTADNPLVFTWTCE
ncbi:MAG: hypothetical protein K2H86_01250, partial [Muribaculaceae bacterium]|nr:hypothetical protein [Muribaculaceae bacterium]